MGTKTLIASGLVVIGLAIGGAQLLDPTRQAPPGPEIEQLDDANDRDRARHEDDGNDADRAENERKLSPAEHRPAEKVRPKIRVRW